MANGSVINSYTTVLRRAEVAHEAFAAYWRDVHGPLCARLPGLGWYVQHHFRREHDAHLWRSAEGVGPLPGYVLDGAVEIGFDSAEGQRTFQKASPILFVDEQNVFAETVAYDLPSSSKTFRDRFFEAHPNADERTDRLHVHFHAVRGREQDLAEYLTEHVATPFAEESQVLKVRLHLPDPHDNTEPKPPAPGVKHDVEPARVALGILEIAFASPLERRRFFASPTFERPLQAQTGLVSHVSAFSVSGVYTFVHDGALTLAGLRGSRAAELVVALAAENQTTPEVSALFTRG